MATQGRNGKRNLTDSYTSVVTSCVSKSEKTIIDQLAAKRGLKRSVLIREALKFYLTAQSA